MTVELLCGDSRDLIELIPSASIDAVVCDPPYALVSVQKRFGKPGAAAAAYGSDGLYARASRGFMGKQWDTGEVAFDPAFWFEVLRVLKPGGHVVAFSGTRTYHRLACAIEDAGFEIRDMLSWLYGTGFPKSHDVSKGIDAKLKFGTSRTEDIRRIQMGEAYAPSGRGRKNYDHGGGSAMNGATGVDLTSERAAEWQGWGTALKPACEPIVFARKPLIGTVAENVLAHGTGAINVDGCRVPTDEVITATRNIALGSSAGGVFGAADKPGVYCQSEGGRWPANVVHDGSDEVLAAFPSDAARFFYSAKASKKDRAGSKHPTVKPVALMRWLCRLVTPPGGTVLDPFAGSGTTGQAAVEEGFSAVLMEREAEYQADIRRRLNLPSPEVEEVAALSELDITLQFIEGIERRRSEASAALSDMFDDLLGETRSFKSTNGFHADEIEGLLS